jgi:hypothetical protein
MQELMKESGGELQRAHFNKPNVSKMEKLSDQQADKVSTQCSCSKLSGDECWHSPIAAEQEAPGFLTC